MRAFGDHSAANSTFGGRLLGTRGAVASEHYLSAQAGIEILEDGGNAFDAAAAAILVEGLVNPHMFTIGGECPMLLYPESEGRVVAVNGNTMAPGLATLDAYLARGLELIPPDGVLASGVPAAMGALLAMLERYGSLPLKRIVEFARDSARDGYPTHEGLVGMPKFSIVDLRDRFLSQWPGSAALYLKDGRAPEVGELLFNAPLADMLDAMANAATKAQAGSSEPGAGFRAAMEFFYKGEPARAMAAYAEERDGFLRRSDFERFETRFEDSVHIRFRGAEIHKCGPWSQGPVFLEILGLMDGFDLEGMGHNSADYLHLWIEAAKLAFADREQFYADPEQVAVPVDQLLSAAYADKRRALIDMSRADNGFRPGDPIRGQALLPQSEIFTWKSWGYGTVHVAVADRFGNLAACTPSGGWIAGNDTIPSLGFSLGTRLQTFYLDARHPNAPAPFKRPRTSLTPSMAIFDGGAPEKSWKMAFGTMGGDQQDQWTSQFFLNRLVFGMGIQEAIEAPKATSDHFPGIFYPHSAFPGQVSLEDRIGEEVRNELAARGHGVNNHPGWAAGFVCAAMRYGTGLLEAGADPRGSKARVFPAAARVR